jgi:hypothetical protein
MEAKRRASESAAAPYPPQSSAPIIVPFCVYVFRSTIHSQCESPWNIFLVSLNLKFGFKLSTAPSPPSIDALRRRYQSQRLATSTSCARDTG